MDIIIAHLPNLALAYFVFFLAVASPGPATLAIAGASMSLGRPQGIAKAAGIVSGSFLWGMFAVFGMVASSHHSLAFFIGSKSWAASICFGWPIKRERTQPQLTILYKATLAARRFGNNMRVALCCTPPTQKHCLHGRR